MRAHGLGLRIHLYWNPPDRSCDRHPGDRCDDSDVDLHLLRPEANAWFDNAGDCHYANCRQGLSWDAAGSEDDPRMDIDDTEGHGPENINIDRPVEGNTYRVGVHYYDQARWGDSDAYVSVFCGDISINPVITYGPVTLRNGGAQNGDFWRVADVRWDGALGCTVFDIDPWGADLDTAADARAQR